MTALTDKTIQVVSQLKDDRIKLIKLEKKGGAQRARNIGIMNASGEWIAFLDSDDTWEKDKLKIQMMELANLNYPTSSPTTFP